MGIEELLTIRDPQIEAAKKKALKRQIDYESHMSMVAAQKKR